MKMNRTFVTTVVVLIVTLSQRAQAFYNPSTGRWLSRDPIEEPAHQYFNGSIGGPDDGELDEAAVQANAYPLVMNNPVVFVDPLGDEVLKLDSVNCLGYAMGLGLHIEPSQGESLEQMLRLYGWTCKGPTGRKCKPKKEKGVVVEDVFVLYIYDARGFEKGQDPFKSPWPASNVDYHSIKRCSDDKWRYIPNRDCPIGTEPKDLPKPGDPDSYPWPDGKTPKLRYCCSKGKKS